jgi:hypothetical protein
VEEVREMPSIEFLAPNVGEKLAVVREVPYNSSLHPIRRSIVGRPFWLKDLIMSSHVTIRCVVRRDELAPGVLGWEGARSWDCLQNDIECTTHPLEDLERLQMEWLRISRGDYGEGLDLLDPEEVADEEEKVFAKVVKVLGPRFAGMWSEELSRRDFPEGAVFLRVRTKSGRGKQITLNFQAVDIYGDILGGAGNLFDLVGDGQDGSKGYLRVHTDITEEVPFDLAVGDSLRIRH